MQQKNDELKPLIEDVFKFGDMLLVANKGVGKTNALMCLASEIRKLPNTRLIIFEDFPKFAKEFDNIPYMRIKDRDVTETKHEIDFEDFFLRHSRDYTVKRGAEIRANLEQNKDLIFTMEISDIERTCYFVYSVVNYFYRKAYLRAYKNYQKHERIVFLIEEAQNVFDSSIVSKKLFNRLRKIFSVARNLGLHFILASQRLQDLNTKIRGRTRLLLGNVSLDDYELKINRLLKHSAYRKEILDFERGKFLYTANDKTIKFSKFAPTGEPHEIKPLRKTQIIGAPTQETKNKVKEKMPFVYRFLKRLVPETSHSKNPKPTKWSENLDESEELEDEREWEEFLIEEEEWE